MPKSLMQALPEVDELIQATPRVALFLDFDGTLAPIVDDPAVARLSADTCGLLQQIVQQESIVTTVISGRAVEDVFVRIHIQGIIYAGNHGMEIFGRGLRFIEPVADERRNSLRRLAEELMIKLQPVPGVIVEDKGLTASIHYRQAAPADLPEIESAVRSEVAAAGALFRLNTGRKVLEIMPRTGWHKGSAVEWILCQLGNDGALPIYLGDDNSDEDAFAVLSDGVTIRVGGPPETCAQYRLPDPHAVYEFLLWLENRAAGHHIVE